MPSATDVRCVRELQERAARAQPAAHVTRMGGWWLRHAPGCGWWIGSVLPHGEADPGDLADMVVRAEEFYAGRGEAARFQITPGACPARLDTLLAERGYRRRGALSLQVAPTARVLAIAPATAPRVRVSDHPTGEWFEVWRAVSGDAVDAGAEWELLDRVPPPRAYACVMFGDDAVAVGRAAVDTGWAGVFGMATLPAARGTGAGRRVLAALAGWAGEHRADRMYLQVERDNLAAVRRYEQAGFREICGYHYRTAASG